MMKYLVGTLIGYLIIGVVYTLVKLVREVAKRLKLLGNDDYIKWLEGTNHLDEFDIGSIANDEYWSMYVWYIRFINKLYDIKTNKVLLCVVYVLTWPTAVPLVIEVIAKALDVIYESRFGEEG